MSRAQHRSWVLLLCVTMGCGQESGQNPPVAVGAKIPQVGREAPEITGPDLDGKVFKLSDYRGKVVMLDFWGHW